MSAVAVANGRFVRKIRLFTASARSDTCPRCGQYTRMAGQVIESWGSVEEHRRTVCDPCLRFYGRERAIA